MLLQVEQHNRKVHQGFAQQMDGAFSDMQRFVQQQSKHHSMLSSFPQAIGETHSQYSNINCRTSGESKLSGSSSEEQECRNSEVSGTEED